MNKMYGLLFTVPKRGGTIVPSSFFVQHVYPRTIDQTVSLKEQVMIHNIVYRFFRTLINDQGKSCVLTSAML
ncbi:hypothetical protein AX758_05325 [Enterococcus mundtii]|uniref:hypothetical protein n=1 Tax=Enterococcus sp. AZ140 TaxID=2774731 RepID=UPI0008059289|nr:hypothetical protein AX758_05325 [Enterococcus mundtii]